MSYFTIAVMHQDPTLRARVAACCAAEGMPDPESWAARHAWALAAQPGWAAAWESALVTNDCTDPAAPLDGTPPQAGGYCPGADGTAITDGMILSAVQHLVGLDAAEPTD